MLQNLHVKNLALIDEVEVEFGPGLNILTGETGAGKSIILGSVNLALGGRYSRDILREGASYGLVELTFAPENEKLLQKLEGLDIVPEDGIIVLSRRLMDGRSASRINGETVTMAKLKEAAGILIDIHGQHEHQSLLYKKNQLQILDAYAGEPLRKTADKVRGAYKAYKKCLEEWEQSRLDESERAKETSFLEFEIQEIEEADLTLGEDEQLESDYRRMNNARNIVENAAEAYEYTGGMSGGSASEQISRAIRCMSDAARYDEKAEELYEQLSELDGLLNDFNRELSGYQDSLQFSEEEYYETEERLNLVNHLKTKYGNSIEQVLEYCEEKRDRLQVLEDYDSYLGSLREELAKNEKKLKKAAKELTSIRKEQGKLLEKQIGKAMQELNFVDVKFQIQFEELADYTANGRDDVEFMISMNPGEPVKPLAGVASGGELSRMMLAIKAVMADRDEIETLIFDEIDVGISGRTAQKVSEKMAVIGDSHQVICITHLAQIAAMADAHYVIEKTVEKGKTRTGIRLLEDEETTEELARILGGAKITDTVRENAREMKKLAGKHKQREMD